MVRVNVPIRAIVFDFGGPVVKTPFEMVDALESRLGVAPGTLGWSGPFADSGAPDVEWCAVLAGRLGERDYWRHRAKEAAPWLGSACVVDTFTALFADPAEFVRPEALAALEVAERAGLLTGILTNDVSVFHEPGWVDRVPFVGRVDVYVDASVCGVLKPDPRAYRRVLEDLHVSAEEAVFVDDMPHNVCGASEVGMASVLFDVTDPVGSYDRVLAAAGLDAHVR